MSTRANIIVRDSYDELIFYRHSDGYPEGALPLLQKFLAWVKEGRIRDCACQASGWLILLGAKEYSVSIADGPPDNWCCGAIEPTTAIHGDIQYLYVVDLVDEEIYIDGQNGFEYSGKFA